MAVRELKIKKSSLRRLGCAFSFLLVSSSPVALGSESVVCGSGSRSHHGYSNSSPVLMLAQADTSAGASASAEPYETRLEALEGKFFGEVHKGDTADRRMDRLEKFVYGQANTGPIPDRLQAMESGMLQKNPDGTSPKPLLPTSAPIIPPQGIPVPTPEIPDPPAEEQKPAGGGKAGASPTSAAAGAQSGPLRLSLVRFRDVRQPRRVIEELNEAINSDASNNADLFFQRAKAWLELEDYGKALADLTDAIQKEPMKCEYYLARATVLNKIGKNFLAQKDLTRARFVNPMLPSDVTFDKDAGGE